MSGAREAARVLVDTDPGLDDLLALAFALAAPELRVEALTTVAGNAPLAAVTENAARFLEWSGSRIPLGEGAAEPLDLSPRDALEFHGEHGRAGLWLPEAQQPAPDSALRLLRRCLGEGRLDRIVALGPLTNLALLLREEAELLAGVEIVWMGGSLAGGNVTPWAEFNCYADPSAAATVLGSGLRIRVIGLEVTRQCRLRPSDLPPEPFGRGPRAEWLAELLNLLMQAEGRSAGTPRATLHDPAAVAAAIDPGLFDFEPRRVAVDVAEGERRGEIVERSGPGGPAVQWAVAVDAPRLIERFLDNLRDWAGAEATRRAL